MASVPGRLRLLTAVDEAKSWQVGVPVFGAFDGFPAQKFHRAIYAEDHRFHADSPSLVKQDDLPSYQADKSLVLLIYVGG